VSTPSQKKLFERESELIVGFLNTRDFDEPEDRIASPRQLEEWIAASGAGIGSPRVDPSGHRRALELRESLRALLLANNGAAKPAEAELEPLRAAAGRARLRTTLGEGGTVQVEPAEDGLPSFEARVLLAVERIQALGAWERLKACPADDCREAFVDTSRNRSRTWCSMDVCGNRSKTRRYRSRRAAR
jgi:predicted RNA-binding Zn ribbon-like protein